MNCLIGVDVGTTVTNEHATILGVTASSVLLTTTIVDAVKKVIHDAAAVPARL